MMFLKVVIYRNGAFVRTHSNKQKDITELKQKHTICLGMGLSQTDKIIILNQSATLAGYILNPKILCEYIGASFNINSNILQVKGLPKKE